MNAKGCQYILKIITVFITNNEIEMSNVEEKKKSLGGNTSDNSLDILQKIIFHKHDYSIHVQEETASNLLAIASNFWNTTSYESFFLSFLQAFVN